MRRATLCLPMDASNRVLLGLKNKEKFGGGYWNGFGGQVEEGESFLVAAARELKEEVGLDVLPQALTHVASVRFFFTPDMGKEDHHVEFYLAREWKGEPVLLGQEFAEARWFSSEEIPFERMWAADRLIFSRILKGEKIRARVHFRRGSRGPELLGVPCVHSLHCPHSHGL